MSEPVSGEEGVRVDVATPNAEPAPVEEYTSKLLEAVGDEVERPEPPEPQAIPVLEIEPFAENWAQPDDCDDVTIKLVVEAVPETVRPPVAVPLPIVDEAETIIPFVPPLTKLGNIKRSVRFVIFQGIAVVAYDVAGKNRTAIAEIDKNVTRSFFMLFQKYHYWVLWLMLLSLFLSNLQFHHLMFSV